MNLLSGLDWRTLATEQPGLFSSVTVSPEDVIGALAERDLVDIDVREFLQTSHQDTQVAEVLKQCVLQVSDDSDYWRSATEPAPPVDRRPGTWLEAHPLDDKQWLVIPGEGTASPTLSFWTEDPYDGRPRVVSFVAGVTGRLAGVLFHRSKQCQEDFKRTGICGGIPGGCECESAKSLEGLVIIDICCCAE
jgi:hypothetical protein